MNENQETASSGYIQIISRRWWLFILLPLITILALVALNASSQPDYVAYERLQVIPSDTLQVSLFSRTPTLAFAQQVQSVHDDFYDVVRSSAVVWKTIADLGLQMSAEDLIKRLDTQDQFEFITVSVRMASPELAQQVVEAHTQNAIAALRQIRITPAQATLSFLQEQTTTQRQALEQARAQLQQFQLTHELNGLSDEINAAQAIRRTLTAERDRLQAEAARTAKLAESYQQLADENRRQAAALQEELDATVVITTIPETTANAGIDSTELMTRTVSLLSPEKTRATAQQLDNLLSRIAEQERLAQQNRSLSQGHQAAIDVYNNNLHNREQQIEALLKLQDQYNDLTSKVKDAQGSYDFLVDKTNEARLKVAAGNESYLKVIEPARRPRAPEPRHLPQLMAVGILASLLLALVLAFLLDMLERARMGAAQSD